MLSSALFAQEVAGDWQGTLKVMSGLRLVVKIRHADGALTASLFSIDQGPDWGAGIQASTVSLEGSTLRFSVDMVRGKYEGTLSPDGKRITGTWTQGKAFPLEFERATPETAWKDPSSHRARMVGVAPGVDLEVLDWGGSGRPLVLLAGLGNSAHVFDKFAPKLADTYHVYGVTRRGFGSSSAPKDGYDADRLGDDVLGVLDQLKIEKPVLAGHSIAGQELSSIASRLPERVAGLVYLDAGYGYAIYDESRGDFMIDLNDIRSKLDRMRPGKSSGKPKEDVDELLIALPRFEALLKERRNELAALPPALLQAQASGAGGPAEAILAGERRYLKIPARALAIYAVPKRLQLATTAEGKKAFEEFDTARTEAQIKTFTSGVMAAKIVRLPGADHYVFLSNEADVLREMRAFIDDLAGSK